MNYIALSFGCAPSFTSQLLFLLHPHTSYSSSLHHFSTCFLPRLPPPSFPSFSCSLTLLFLQNPSRIQKFLIFNNPLAKLVRIHEIYLYFCLAILSRDGCTCRALRDRGKGQWTVSITLLFNYRVYNSTCTKKYPCTGKSIKTVYRSG